jgi:Leucine-rich repeat (LRR) protein
LNLGEISIDSTQYSILIDSSATNGPTTISFLHTDSSTIVVDPDLFQDTIIHFPDPALDSVVRYHIGAGPSDIVYLLDVFYLQSLSGFGAGIQNLSGISALENLTNLQLGANLIRSTSPMDGLDNLSTLILTGNIINDLNGMQNLLRLNYVELSGNQIRNITPILQNNAQGGIGKGDFLFLIGNPVDTNQVNALCSPPGGPGNAPTIYLQQDTSWCTRQ